MNKVIIAGGRAFNDYLLLKCKCDVILKQLEGEITIIQGGANGADSLGKKYAKDRGYKCQQYNADWDTHGKCAGYIRNKEMAEVGTHLIAFWDGKSPGTKMMIQLASEYNIPTRIIKYA